MSRLDSTALPAARDSTTAAAADPASSHMLRHARHVGHQMLLAQDAIKQPTTATTWAWVSPVRTATSGHSRSSNTESPQQQRPRCSRFCCPMDSSSPQALFSTAAPCLSFKSKLPRHPLGPTCKNFSQPMDIRVMEPLQKDVSWCHYLSTCISSKGANSAEARPL
jgi:hypothetical protein